MSIFTELKQRLGKFEALHGVYKIPLGGLIVYVAWSYIPYWQAMLELQYIIHDMALLVGMRALMEGVYGVWHNPVKLEADKAAAVEQYRAQDAIK